MLEYKSQLQSRIHAIFMFHLHLGGSKVKPLRESQEHFTGVTDSDKHTLFIYTSSRIKKMLNVETNGLDCANYGLH